MCRICSKLFVKTVELSSLLYKLYKLIDNFETPVKLVYSIVFKRNFEHDFTCFNKSSGHAHVRRLYEVLDVKEHFANVQLRPCVHWDLCVRKTTLNSWKWFSSRFICVVIIAHAPFNAE